MGRKNKRYRLATMLRLSHDASEQMSIKWSQHHFERGLSQAVHDKRAERKRRINAARGVGASPYVKDEAIKQAKAGAPKELWQHRARKLKGMTKWVAGMPTLQYAKTVRGITQTFGYSREQERHERHEDKRANGERAKGKEAGRQTFERAKPINAKRLAALKEDKRAERTLRASRMAHAGYWGSSQS